MAKPNPNAKAEMQKQFHCLLAAAYVRGQREHSAFLTECQKSAPLSELSKKDVSEVIKAGLQAGVPLHGFKRTQGLARVRSVLGILHGLQPCSLLDIGSGRGVFLWPLMDAFPDLPIIASDVSDYRIRRMAAVRRGGMTKLNACRTDAHMLPFLSGVFDVVTALEVLEHIQNPEKAARELVRVAQRFVLVSVPSKPDDNPGHVNLFDKTSLTDLFMSLGATSVKVDHVLNHLIGVVRISSERDDNNGP